MVSTPGGDSDADGGEGETEGGGGEGEAGDDGGEGEARDGGITWESEAPGVNVCEAAIEDAARRARRTGPRRTYSSSNGGYFAARETRVCMVGRLPMG